MKGRKRKKRYIPREDEVVRLTRVYSEDGHYSHRQELINLVGTCSNVIWNKKTLFLRFQVYNQNKDISFVFANVDVTPMSDLDLALEIGKYDLEGY